TRALRELNADRPSVPPAPAPVPAKPTGYTERLTMAATAAANDLPKPVVIECPPLIVALTSLAEAWPEAVRKEIVEANLVDAKVALPHDSVKQALKQGRIAFSWKTVRSWVKSQSSPPVSAQDSTVLELPLKIV